MTDEQLATLIVEYENRGGINAGLFFGKEILEALKELQRVRKEHHGKVDREAKGRKDPVP